ncbi:MAG: DHH family phosphoesterase [Caldisphaera sp.]|jgi:oligoribonuclease NrnB/cAMP/cGMP phosphodiesterase (DHH superfamily)|nr:DHHA1 domain-containing protein [Caldisphaera sp.]
MDYVNNLFIITHTDLDGMGGAAALMRVLNKRPEETTIIFSEPYNVDEALSGIIDSIKKGDMLALIDIGSNDSNFDNVINGLNKILENGGRVQWYDHHIWDQSKIAKLKSIGVELFIDKSTCGTGVVAKYSINIFKSKDDPFLLKLEKAICASDIWKWDDELGPKLFRATYAKNNQEGREWKMKVIEKFFNGIIWDDELRDHLNDYLKKELNGFDSILSTLKTYGNSNKKIAAVYKENDIPSDSLVGAMILSREDAAIAVIIKKKSARIVSISLRSKEKANVQIIAKEFGGGGHIRASGAILRLPFYIYLLSIINKSFLINYVLKKVYYTGISLSAFQEIEHETNLE